MALDIYPIPDRPITVIAEGIMQARRVVRPETCLGDHPDAPE